MIDKRSIHDIVCQENNGKKKYFAVRTDPVLVPHVMTIEEFEAKYPIEKMPLYDEEGETMVFRAENSGHVTRFTDLECTRTEATKEAMRAQHQEVCARWGTICPEFHFELPE